MSINKNNLITSQQSVASVWQVAFAIFLFHPFLGFVLSLFNLKNRWSFLVIFLFFILFGYTFIAENEFADSYRYIKQFNNYKYISFNNFLYDLKSYFTFSSNIKDFYTYSSYFIISRFTYNYHILMAFWALIFTFFFLKSFRFFVDRIEFNRSYVSACLAFMFIFSNNIFNINGVRFNTSAWIAVFIIFEYLLNKNKKILLLAVILPFIHITYISFIVVILTYIFLGRFRKLLIWLYFFSFVFSEISLQFIHAYNDFFPTPIQNLILDYATGSNLENRIIQKETLPVYAKLLNSLPRFFINSLIVIIISARKQLNFTLEENSVLNFILVWMTFCNFTMVIPSFGARFFMLSIPIVAFLTLITVRKVKFLKYYLYIIPFVFSYQILYWIRDMITVTDPILIFSFFPHIIYKNLFL